MAPGVAHHGAGPRRFRRSGLFRRRCHTPEPSQRDAEPRHSLLGVLLHGVLRAVLFLGRIGGAGCEGIPQPTALRELRGRAAPGRTRYRARAPASAFGRRRRMTALLIGSFTLLFLLGWAG